MFDKKVKLLLMIINKDYGIEMNYETITRYSQKYDALLTEYHLKIWNKKIYVDEETGEEKEKWYCKDKEFHRIDQVIKYLLAIKDDKNGKRTRNQ